MIRRARCRFVRLTALVVASGAAPLLALPMGTPLEGKWVVCSATWQMGGRYTYHFHDNTLTIETRIDGGKDGREPPSLTYERFTFFYDATKTPHELVLTKIVAPGLPRETRVETVKFDQLGRLWLQRNHAWETGLERVVELPPAAQTSGRR